jgi:glutaredoxin
MISLLSRWARRRKPIDASHLRVVVYTRAQCGCCHKALDLLEGYRRRHGFSLETVDSDADPALVERYNTTVPVVAIDGKVRFKGVVNPVLFERLLEAEGRGRDRGR